MIEEKCVHIERSPLTQAAFDELYQPSNVSSSYNKIQATIHFSARRIRYIFPIIRILRYYHSRQYIISDILSAIAVGLFNIPHALAYGLLSSTKVENGLYTSIWPVLLYAVFGTSKHASPGTSAVISIFTASIVDQRAQYFEGYNWLNLTKSNRSTEAVLALIDHKENIAASVALLTGIILVVLGFLRLGFISYLLSEPFLKAFTSAAAIHMTVSQLPLLLGITTNTHVGSFKVGFMLKDIFKNLAHVDGKTLLVAVTSILVPLTIKDYISKWSHFFLPIPADLITMIVAVIVSSATSLNREVAVVGSIANSIPKPVAPDLIGWKTYIFDCFILSILIYTINIQISKTFSKKHNYIIDSEQEMIAHGICNFVGAFFKCLPTSFSHERSMILSKVNVKSTVTGIFVTLFMFVSLIISPYIFESLPQASLAAIIVVSLKGLYIQTTVFLKYWRINKCDFFVWTSTFIAVVFLNLKFGFLIGILVSLITVVVKSQFSHGYRVGQTFGDKIMVEHKKYRGSKETPGVKVFRFHSNLYFATAETFKNSLYKKTVNPRKLLKYMKKQERQRIKQLKKVANSLNNNSNSNQFTNGSLKNDQTVKTLKSNGETNNRSNESCVYIISDVHPMMIEYKNSFSFNSESPYTISRQVSQALDVESTVNCLTGDGEELDPEDGQAYVTEKSFKKMCKVHHVIVDFSSINYLDITGAKMLRHISSEYESVNIKLFISGCSADIKKTMLHAGILDTITTDNIFLDLYDALAVAIHSNRPFFYSGEKNDDTNNYKK